MADNDSDDYSAMSEDDASSFQSDDDVSFDGGSDFADDDENVAVVAAPAKATSRATKATKKPAAAAKSKKASSKPPKKAAAAAAAAAKSQDVLSPSKQANAAAPSSSISSSSNDNNKSKKKTVEEKYQKKSQLEHILLRPDTYIGSTEPLTAPMYVLSGDHQISQKEITFTPGLYKIFDEIVVNAADNRQRCASMDRLEITIDADSNTISVRNNGEGIPVEFHQKEKMYVPTLIFGHLLTGSNFDDHEKKTTGGRNGYGAKLANVFSTEFVVECLDAHRQKKFRQVFRDNMSVAEPPQVRDATAKECQGGDFVQVTFRPDLRRFQMDCLDGDTVALLSKRAYDIAGTMGSLNSGGGSSKSSKGGKRLQVYLNGEKLPIKSFKDYVNCITTVESPVAYASDDARWEVAVAPSPDGTPVQISFVNSIATYKGGAHVAYIADQVAAHLCRVLNKKSGGGKSGSGSDIKRALVVNHCAIFVNCLIENPAFDSQTKDFLTTRKNAFGSTFELPTDVLKKIEKSEISRNILAYSSFRDRQALNRKGGTKKIKMTGIPKLDDANLAGSAKSRDCTLIITEGDSAKSLAVAGLSVVGRDYYGVFPLKGKPMNVRDENPKKAATNPELANIVSILGLKYNQAYDATTIKSLRYGHLMIMADQDVDGSHIKGLVINFIHTFWPSLLDVPGFLQQFITPIVKVRHLATGQERAFYTLPEYEQWQESVGGQDAMKQYKPKYYKGLGTSTSAEAKVYFSNLDTHQVTFGRLSTDIVQVDDDDDDDAVLPDKVESGSDLIDMVFRKDRVEDRKRWLLGCPKDVYLDYTAVSDEGLKYSDFINREYIQFSKYDNDRSIPHLLDGLKTSQRKVLFGCFKRNLTKQEAKVAQLTGYIAEHSAYHHGEQSLMGTIVNMAQNYVGSNNINLLMPNGQFGTRRMGGKDAASARYIFTKLAPIARTIFHPDDDELLTYLVDDGSSIEPEFYLPVIPMVLVNGAEGIGTGWSSTVLNYNPRDVIANLRRKIAGEPLEPLLPYYDGFIGAITAKSPDKFDVSGIIERVDDTTLLITELPVKKWTQPHKEFLEGLLVGDAKKPAEIKDLKENHTETTVSFTITADKANIDQWQSDKKGLEGKFKLTGSLSASNMTLFDEEYRITKYDDPNDILNAFYTIRLDYYDKRKAHLILRLEADKLKLSNKARFVEEVCSGDLIVSNRKKVELLDDLQSRGYDLILKNEKKDDGDESEGDADPNSATEEPPTTAKLAKGYEYLLGMAIWSLTFEKAEQLRKQLEEKKAELEILQAKAPSDIWLADLEAVEKALDDRAADMEQAASNERKAQNKNRKHVAAKKSKAAAKKAQTKRKKKKADEWDSEMEEESEPEQMNVDSDEEDEVVVVQKKPAAKRAPKGAAKKPAAKPAAKAKPATAVTKSQAAKRPPAKDSDGEDSDMEEGLMARMLAKKMQVSPQPKKVNRNSNGSSDGKRPSPRDANDSSDEDDFLAEKEAAGSKKGAEKDDLDFDDSDNEKVVVARKPKKKAAAKKKAAPAAKKKPAAGRKKKTIYDDDDDSVEMLLSSDDDILSAPAAAAPVRGAPRRAARAKPTKYNFGSDEESDDDNDSE